ncbi:MAG: DUF11 domain-containing protein [Euryarchaeota archaeon]|nr:DUF11 domain-containing protein [Euryarchaeota archaeon]
MKLLLFFILLIFLPVAAAEKINGLEVEWESSATYTLSWTNPSISKGDYVIKVIDFNWKGDAAVTVDRGEETQHGILSQGVNSIFDFTKNTRYFEGVRIYPKTVSNFLPFPTNIGTYPCCPAAEITVTLSKAITQKKPVLELALSPDWDGRAGFTSVMNLQIKNTGDADFSGGNVTINISGLEIANEKELSDYALTYNPSKGTITRGWSTPLLAGSSHNVAFSLRSPFPSNKSTFTISAQSYFKDFNGNVYPATASATVSLVPAISLKKFISASTIFRDRIYTRDEIDTAFLPKFFGLQTVTVVNIYVQNTQSYPVKSVILNDTIMESFRLIDNATLQWVFDLNASERKEFRYEIAAQKTGTFTAPAAVAQWNEWGVSKTICSDRPTTRVYGVFVVVSKKTDKTSLKLNESLNVTITLENIGDFPVGMNVTDIPPKNTTFISGTTAFSGYLYSMEKSDSLKYSLSADNPGELELPSPEVTFWKKDYEGAYGFIPADKITVLEPSVVLPNAVTTISYDISQAPAETPLPKSLLDIIDDLAPWFEGAVPIIMLIIAIILMLMLHVTDRRT